MEPLPCRPPAEATSALCVHRADRLLEGAMRLVDVLPMVARAPIKAAKAAAGAWLRLRLGFDADPFDPFTWRQRGLDLSGGVGVWDLPEDQSVIVVAVSWRAPVESFLEEVARHLGLSERECHGDRTVFVGPSTETSCRAAGLFAGHVWLAELRGDASLATARAFNDRLARLAVEPDDGPLARRLASLPGPDHTLRLADNGKNDLAIGVALSRSEVSLHLHMPAEPKMREVLGFLCCPGLARGVSLPAGALVVLSGVDLGQVVRESYADRSTPEERADDAAGVALLAIHDLDPAALGALVEGFDAFAACLARGDVRGSLWMRPHDEARWRVWLADMVTDERGQLLGQGSARTYFVPHTREASWGAWLGLEQGSLLGALTQRDLSSLRTAARLRDGGLARSIADPATRARLDRGEPFVYVRVADLAAKMAARERSSWRWQGLGQRLARDATLSEVITWLRLVEDATAQASFTGEGDDSRLDASLRLRVR